MLGFDDVIAEGSVGYVTNSSSSAGLSFTNAEVRFASPSIEAPFSTTSNDFDPTEKVGEVGNTNPAGFRIPNAKI